MARLRVSASPLLVAVAVSVACVRNSRVVSASRTRHSSSRRHAATPSRRRCRHTRTLVYDSLPYAVHCKAVFSLFIFFEHRYFVFCFFRLFLYAVFVLLYLYSLRVAARFFAFPSHCSRTRRVAAPSTIALNSVFVVRCTSHLRRVAIPSASASLDLCS